VVSIQRLPMLLVFISLDTFLTIHNVHCIHVLQALEALNKKDITEIKSYGKPPPLVEKVLEAVMILRGNEPTWAEAKRQLGYACSHFYARKQLCFQRVLAIAFCLSVCPSVCPSVCLSHGWIRQKWSKLGSPNLHHRLPGRL